jgi:nucleoside-diphosphate-sugar epimerase
VILVTGGTGFVGRRLVNLLVSQGSSVRVLTRAGARVVLPPGVETAQGDLTDPESLARALSDIRAVVHLAARVSAAAAGPGDMDGVNALGTANLARAARAAGVRQLVHGSSAGVYGDGAGPDPHRENDPPNPGNAYERSKLAGEAALRAELAGADVRWAIVRPAGIYGPGRPATAALFREVAHRRLWLHGPVPVIVHPTHVDDVASAIQLILGREDAAGETFNIGGERALDYTELIALIGARMGRGPMQARSPRWTARVAGLAAGAWRIAGRAAPARLERLSLPMISRAVDTTKARRVLGFAPVSLERGLDEVAAAVRAGEVR